MRRFLDQALGERHEVRMAPGGEKALEILESWTPDLVVTDLMMPGMDGETLARRIRERPEIRDLPAASATDDIEALVGAPSSRSGRWTSRAHARRVGRRWR